MITVSDDDGQLAVFNGERGSLGSYYGPAAFVSGLLIESDHAEMAEWVESSGAGLVAWITGMEVEKEDRGHGIGATLVRRALSEFAKRSVEIVFLQAKADRGYGLRLAKWYTRLGFTRRGDLDGLPFFYILPTRHKRSSRRSSRRRR